MNGLVIVLIAIVVLGAGYLLYGRWLASKWGLDPKAKTPAYTHEDGQDYVPSSKLTAWITNIILNAITCTYIMMMQSVLRSSPRQQWR